MLRVALRTNTWSAVGFGALALFLLPFLALAYAALGDDRAAAQRDLETIAPAFSFILPLPQRLDTNAGYVAWFGYGQLTPILAFWGVLAGTFASRGEEERGLTDLWLAAGASRQRVLVAHLVAFAAAAVAVLAVGAVAVLAAAGAAGEPIPAGALLLQSSGVLAIALSFFAVGLVTGQVMPTRRGALGVGALALVLLFLTNSFSRQWAALSSLRWISPFAYSDRTHGLVPGLEFNAAALAVLIAVGGIGSVAALGMFLSRDVGATLGRRGRSGVPRRTPATNPFLRSQILATLYDQRVSLFIWSLALSFQGFSVTRMASPFLRALAQADPNDPAAAQLRTVAGAGHGGGYEGFLGFQWFGGLAALALAVYAITQVARWSSDDNEGRLEALLSAPVSRPRVIVERAVALAAGAGALIVVSHAAIAVGSVANDISLDDGRLLIASFMLLPVAGIFGGLGAAASAWRPRLTVSALSALAFVSLMLPFVTPVIRGPDWLDHFSVFDLYGSPLADGFVPWRFGLLAGIAAIGFAIAVFAMLRRDVGR